MTSLFLTKLPIEIRKDIYELAFRYDGVDVRDKPNHEFWIQRRIGSYSYFVQNPPDEVLALLHVNRQISQEAAASFYTNTKFTGFTADILSFLNGISGFRRDLIATINMVTGPISSDAWSMGSTGFRYNYQAENFKQLLKAVIGLLSTMTGLRTVNIGITPELRRHSRRIQLWLIDYGILELTGKFDLCVFCWFGEQHRPESNVLATWSCAEGDTEWKHDDAPLTNRRVLESFPRP